MTQIDPKQSAALWERAREYADRYHPRPKVAPSHAGMYGAAIVGFTLAIFSGLQGGMDIGIPGLITIAIGFAIPFFYFRAQENRNTEAVVREFGRLEAEAKAAIAASRQTTN